MWLGGGGEGWRWALSWLGQWPGWPCGVKGESSGSGPGTWAQLLVTPPKVTRSAFECPLHSRMHTHPARQLLASRVCLRDPKAASFCLLIPEPCSRGCLITRPSLLWDHHVSTCRHSWAHPTVRPSCAGRSTDGSAENQVPCLWGPPSGEGQALPEHSCPRWR